MIHKSRQADLEQLRQDYARTTDPNIRRQISDAGRRIANETKKIESMRESLIREHRKGRMDNVKDIHERIKNDSRYYQDKNGRLNI